MEKYVKPMCLANEDLAEGVYAASGDCYTFSARIVQTPELGNEVYTLQIDGVHNADHHSTARTVVITFNYPVEYVSSLAESYEGSGTNQLRLLYTAKSGGNYHNNFNENIGLGELKVKAQSGLIVTGTFSDYCNETCEQHQ